MKATIDGMEVMVRKAGGSRWGFEVETKDGFVIGWGADVQEALIDAKKNVKAYDLKVA